MTLLLTPARIAAFDVPIVGADGQAGNDGSPMGAPAHAPRPGANSASVNEKLTGLQANETGAALNFAPTVVGGTAGRGGSGTYATAQNGGHDGWGGDATVSISNLGIGSRRLAFAEAIRVIVSATGGFAGGGGVTGLEGPAGSAGQYDQPYLYHHFATNGGNGGAGGNGGGALASIGTVTSVIVPNAVGNYALFAIWATGEDGTSGGDGGRGGDGASATTSGAGGAGGSGGRSIAEVTGVNAYWGTGNIPSAASYNVDATAGNGANGGVGGAASLRRAVLDPDAGQHETYGVGGNGGTGGNGGRAAAVLAQNTFRSASVASIALGVSATAGVGGQGGAGGYGGSASGSGGQGSVTAGVSGAAGAAGVNGQALVAMNANHVFLAAGSDLTLRIVASIGAGVGMLNTPGGPVLQFNGNVLEGGGGSILALGQVFGASATVDIDAGTLSIANSPSNTIGGFSMFQATAGGGDTIVDGAGSQDYQCERFNQDAAEIIDFRPGHGADSLEAYSVQNTAAHPFADIHLNGFGPSMGTFAQVAAAAQDAGDGTQIATPDGGSIFIHGLYAAALVAENFHFG